MNPTGKGGFSERPQDINKKGRNKKEKEEEFQKILLSEVSPTEFREIIATVKRKAKQGEYQFVKLLFDYLIGPPVQRQELTGSDGGALTIHIVNEEEE